MENALTTTSDSMVNQLLRYVSSGQELILDYDAIRGADDEKLLDYLKRLSIASISLTKATGVIKYVLGLILIEIKSRPSIYKSTYGSFEQFVSVYVAGTLGISRSYIWEGIMEARRLPFLTIEQVEALGSTKLHMLARAIDYTNPNLNTIINNAIQMNTAQLQRYLHQKGYLSQEDSEWRTLKIKRSTYETLMEIAKNPQIQAVVGSSSIDDILLAMAGEFVATYGQGGSHHSDAAQEQQDDETPF